MRQMIEEVLRRYGQTVTVHLAGGDTAVRAFLQPVTGRQEQVPSEMTGLGAVDGRLWLYLGQTAVEPGDRMTWNGVTFRVRSSRPWSVGETQLYWWAALERAKEAAT